MFGFLNPRPHLRDYRRVYARLCQHQHFHYGFWSLAFHSYEAVFLYQCAVDAGAVNERQLPEQRCCKLMVRGTIREAPDAGVGRFCASLGLLLGAIKLEDDIKDSRTLFARMCRWLLRRRMAKAESYFCRIDPRFRQNVQQLLLDHAVLETRNSAISLDEYVEPTSHAFGYVFGLMSNLPGMNDQRQTFTSLGRKIGAAIIAFDCAVDWKRDRRRGEFNPLPDDEAVLQSLLVAGSHLEEAAVIARAAYGPQSRAALTLDSVRIRLLQWNPLAERVTCAVGAQGKWSQLKSVAYRFLQLARNRSGVAVLAGAAGEDQEERSTYGVHDPDEVAAPPKRPPNDSKKDPAITKKENSNRNGNNCGGNECEWCFCGAYMCECIQCAALCA